jgi:hypothetical protein
MFMRNCGKYVYLWLYRVKTHPPPTMHKDGEKNKKKLLEILKIVFVSVTGRGCGEPEFYPQTSMVPRNMA